MGKKLAPPGEIQPGDKFPLEGKELTPLGEYLSLYSAAMFASLVTSMEQSKARATAQAASAWSHFASGFMSLLSLPAKAIKSGKKAVGKNRSLTRDDHLALLFLGTDDWDRLLWEKQARATWNKSADALKSQHGVNVGTMPTDYPERLKARIRAEAEAKAAELLAGQVVTEPKPEHVPEPTVLAPIAPGMALAVIASEGPVTEPRADNGELPTPTVTEAPADAGCHGAGEVAEVAGDVVADPTVTPETPVSGIVVGETTPTIAGPSSEAESIPEPTPTQPEATATAITQGAPVGGERPELSGDGVEPIADSACTNCEPEPITEVASGEGPLPVGEAASGGTESPEILTSGPTEPTEPEQEPVAPEVVAALAGALAIVPSLPSSPVSSVPVEAVAGGESPLPDGPKPGPEASATDTAQIGDVSAAGDVAPGAVTADGSQGEGKEPGPLPEAPTVAVSEGVADAGAVGQPESASDTVIVGTASLAHASVTLPETEPETAIVETAPDMVAAAGIAAFVAPEHDTSPLVPSPEAVALATGNASVAGTGTEPVISVTAIGDGSDDPLAQERAKVDALLDMAWGEHAASPSEATARHVRSVAKMCHREHPRVFSAVDMYSWRTKTAAYIPQTNNLGRKHRAKLMGTAAYVSAAVAEAALTPEQESTEATLAAARIATLGENAAVAGVIVPDDVQ